MKIANRCDFYSDEEYNHACQWEEEEYLRRQEEEEQFKQYAYEEHIRKYKIKETPVKLKSVCKSTFEQYEPSYGICQCNARVAMKQLYCDKCGQKLDWE